MDEAEIPLGGENATGGRVRVGRTVRRPAGPWTPAVQALLTHLHSAGFAGAPRPLGFDDRGREVLEYVPGTVPWPNRVDLLDPDLDEAGRRRLLELLAPRTRAMADFLAAGAAAGVQPWAGLHDAGHTAAWAADATYIAQHHATWQRKPYSFQVPLRPEGTPRMTTSLHRLVKQRHTGCPETPPPGTTGRRLRHCTES